MHEERSSRRSTRAKPVQKKIGTGFVVVTKGLSDDSCW
jgi:hypothetical protein